MDYYVYIVECSDGSYYTGMTTDVPERINQHNHGLFGSTYLMNKLPVKLLYSERVGDSKFTRRREKQIKHMTIKQKRKLIESSLGLAPE